MIKTEKIFHLKSSRGRKVRVVREHYLREHVPCHSSLCQAGCDNGKFPPYFFQTPITVVLTLIYNDECNQSLLNGSTNQVRYIYLERLFRFTSFAFQTKKTVYLIEVFRFRRTSQSLNHRSKCGLMVANLRFRRQVALGRRDPLCVP